MEFFTLDSRITIQKGKLRIKKLKHDPSKRYWFDSFLLIGILIVFQVDGALNGKPHKWVIVIAALSWIYPHLERIFKLIFLDKWGNTINLAEITDVLQPESGNELETKVVIKVKSGRRKEFVFRTAENQAPGFMDTVREFSSNGISRASGDRS